MQSLRGKLFLSGMDENAASLARKWGLGLELTDFCEARKLEEPAAMEAARARCSGIGSLWLHAPFAELSPCAIDPRVREVVMLRFRQTVQAVAQLLRGKIPCKGPHPEGRTRQIHSVRPV